MRAERAEESSADPRRFQRRARAGDPIGRSRAGGRHRESPGQCGGRARPARGAEPAAPRQSVSRSGRRAPAIPPAGDPRGVPARLPTPDSERASTMKVVAIYNMKGGVGKTTSAVNLSYLAAAGGARVLLWDLDPQGAASFAFRIRPHVEGFGTRSLEGGRALADAIRETD